MSQTNEPAREMTVPLSPVTRARPRVIRGLAWVTVVAVVAALGVKLLVFRAHDPDCRTAAHTMTDAVAVRMCEREYLRTGDPAAGALLADAQRRSGNRAVASAIANGLLVTSARANAFRVLGKIAVDEGRLDAAMSMLEVARDLHRAQTQRGELARDDQAIAGILLERFQYAPALRTLDECITEARAGEDRVMEGYCHVSASCVLALAGSFEGAQQELDHAEPAFDRDRELAWLEYERGNLEQEIQRSPMGAAHHLTALISFEKALRAAERAQIPKMVVSAELNVAFTLSELRRFDEAERHLASAKLIDHDDQFAHERALIAAHLAYRRGNLMLAAQLNDELFAATTDKDDRLDVCATQAHIALAAHDLAGAERWARLGVAEAEAIRAAQFTVELRAWVLSTRREPYELLFLALVRAGRLDEALDVFDQWQGRTLLDALARPSSNAPVDLRGTAMRFDNLGAWLPAAAATPLLQAGAGRLAIAKLRSTDLLVLAVADHELMRVTSGGGRLDVVDLGPIASFSSRIEKFSATPTDRALAEDLGRLLVPDAVFRTTRDTLRVVLDGALSTLPVAALRHKGRPLIAARPIVRSPRISELACVAPPAAPRTATILADAAGDLPGARSEAAALATLLGTTSAVGAEATSTALFAAGKSSLLHVAVHANIDASGGFLAMYDQKLHALDISARRIGPPLVVLSACTSALSNDSDLAGSLATAFLAGGSAQVVATLRPVSDAGAQDLTSRFYRAGGAGDPVHALASIQAALADTNNLDWPSFAVFGHDLCPTKP
jgi:tetratricopeptide (TPR) repeat protein